MDGERDDAWSGQLTTSQPFLSVGIAGLLLGPAVSTSSTYRQSIQFFERRALPAPGILVPVVGVVEIGVVALALLDRVPRLAAVFVIPVLVVAVGTLGPSWQPLGVLTAALGPLGVETIPVDRVGSKPTR